LIAGNLLTSGSMLAAPVDDGIAFERSAVRRAHAPSVRPFKPMLERDARR